MSQRAGQRPEPRSSPGATAFLCVFLSSSHPPPPMVRAGLSSNPEGQQTFLLESVLRLFSKWGKHQGCAGGWRLCRAKGDSSGSRCLLLFCRFQKVRTVASLASWSSRLSRDLPNTSDP